MNKRSIYVAWGRRLRTITLNIYLNIFTERTCASTTTMQTRFTERKTRKNMWTYLSTTNHTEGIVCIASWS